MGDRAIERMTIKAPAERCFAIASDFERYPDWAPDIKKVEILERDGEGRATTVRFDVAALGRSTRLTLAYDYSAAPSRLSWQLAEGDMEKRFDGAFVFEAADDQTEATYEITVDLRVSVPSFLKRRAESRILETLHELKARAES